MLEWIFLEKASHYLLLRPIKSSRVVCSPVVGGYCQNRWVSLWMYSKSVLVISWVFFFFKLIFLDYQGLSYWSDFPGFPFRPREFSPGTCGSCTDLLGHTASRGRDPEFALLPTMLHSLRRLQEEDFFLAMWTQLCRSRASHLMPTVLYHQVPRATGISQPVPPRPSPLPLLHPSHEVGG